MVRSAAALLAVLILPSFASAQVPARSHTVVDDDTLWDLAAEYYRNPFEWRVIWRANESQIDDPNLIYPNQVFVIPGLPADQETVAQVTPITPTDSAAAGMPGQQPAPAPGTPIEDEPRTIFFQDTVVAEGGVVGLASVDRLAVSRDQVYSAPWVVDLIEEPEHGGVIEGFANRGERGSTMRQFHRIRLAMTAPVEVGDRLQSFRIDKTIDLVGRVAQPTGVLEVLAVDGDGVVAVVSQEYARVQPGDMVRPLPTYTLEPGQYAQTVMGGSEAMIMGFAGTAVLSGIGELAFLDLGATDGITVGDEFVLYSESVTDDTEGALRVVGVTDEMATARILSLEDDVFDQGVVVRLAKKMP
jgi:hypothetical protein